MRRVIRIGGLASGLVAIVIALAVGLGGGHEPVRAQGGFVPPCSVDKSAAPSVVPLGYSTRVTLTVHARCALSDTVPAHTVLVVDGSGSMADQLRDLKSVLQAFIRALDLPGHPDNKVAVVKYNSEASTLCPLTNDPSRLGDCIRELTAEGGTAMDAGVREGTRAMTQGRPYGVESHFREVMILTADGKNSAGCSPVLEAAGTAKRQGILMASVAMGAFADTDCMRQAANPGMAYAPQTRSELDVAFQLLAQLVTTPMVSYLTVQDALPANMRLEPGTVNPGARPDGINQLHWYWGAGPPGDYVMTYAVTPLELGDHPVNVAAQAFLTAFGRRESFAFPVPRVQVVDSAGLPTPTPFPTPTPGDIPLPPPPLQPTAAPTPVPQPTRVPGTIFACPGLERLVPAQVVADALANPDRVNGFGQLCRPSLPPGPGNPLRTALGLQAPGKPFHPLFNGVLFECGCP